MTYTVPQLSDLISAAESDISSRFPGGDSRLPVNVLSVLARVLAGAADGLYGYIGAVSQNMFYDTCDEASLARYAAIWGVNRVLPVAGTGIAPFTGFGAVDIPAGTLLARSDGVQYQTTADCVLAGGAGTAPIICLSVGSSTNTAAGSTLTLVSPIAGVSSSVILATAITGGADVETIDHWRSRLIERVQNPPMGGCQTDYVEWALDVAGVTRAWAIPYWQGGGTVGVTFMMDLRANPIPLAGDVANVQAFIEPLRPAGAVVTYFAPTPNPVNFTIHLNPDSTVMRAAVMAQLQALITRESTPGGTLLLTHQYAAIAAATGSGDFTLVGGSNVVAGAGCINTFGGITWA